MTSTFQSPFVIADYIMNTPNVLMQVIIFAGSRLQKISDSQSYRQNAFATDSQKVINLKPIIQMSTQQATQQAVQKVSADSQSVTAHTAECFICGSRKNTQPIQRWKTVSRAVKLIHDHVCSACIVKHNITFPQSSNPNHE